LAALTPDHDLLLTYRLNPWIAVYAGVNTNAQNLEWVESPGLETAAPHRGPAR
jgi:hypothetical protein